MKNNCRIRIIVDDGKEKVVMDCQKGQNWKEVSFDTLGFSDKEKQIIINFVKFVNGDNIQTEQ